MKKKGVYIYGIVPSLYGSEMFESLKNLGVYVISFQNITAIVSDWKETQFDHLDKESLGYLLVHHQKTIEDLHNKGFSMLLPMRFGTVVSSKEKISNILANGYDLILTTLNKIKNLVEINLVATWVDFPKVLELVSEHPEIMTLKRDLQIKTNGPSQIDQIAFGMLVQEKLKDKNTKVELNLLDSLSSTCLDIKTHEVMNDEMVTNSAFLINKNKNIIFEQVVNQLDEEFNGLLNFKLVGPLPCYSFYTIEVIELNQVHVAQAREELGLTEGTSDVEIKKVYQEKSKEFHPDINENNNKEKFNKINKAYHTMLEYSEAERQCTEEYLTSLGKGKAIENLILVKIKE